ncbi:Replication factor C large subunit [uncultured archaeon]|nr:Replication factor C large subunit [uncultured archaeon]
MAHDLFTDKYVPKNFEEFIGNVEIVERAIAWAKVWQEGTRQKPLFLYGASGVGKTALAFLIAKEMGWQLFEMNASDLRDKESIEKIAGAATSNSSLFGGKRLILLDEVDGLQSQDRGGAGAINSIIKEANNPVILTANDAYDKKLVSLRTTTEMLEFKKINYLSIAKHLRGVAAKENIEFDEEAVKELAKNCGGDMRSALLDIQSLAPKVTIENVRALSFRERKEKVFPVMGKIFKGRSIKEIKDAVDSADVSADMLSLWVEENIPRQFDAIDAGRAFDVLSRADVFNGRIMNRQHWGFLKYSIFLSTAGVGLSKTKDYHSFIPMAFPSILSSLSSSSSKREMRKRIAAKIGEKMHCSRRDALADLPFLLELIKNEKYAKDFSWFFGFDEAELAFLYGKKSDDKKIAELVKEAKVLEKNVILERLHGKQATLFG